MAKDGYVKLTPEFSGPGDAQPLIIGVNGKLWNIPRGETSEVPKAVAEEYYRSKRATMNQYKKIRDIESKS